MKVVNLSSRPFLNSRPVRRLALALWLLGAVLLVDNLWHYWSHLTGFSSTQSELAEVEARIDAEREGLRELERELGGLDIASQNQEVAYLNVLIARRTFPWSLLFDHLAEVLPDQVRLTQVQPQVRFAEKPGVRSVRDASARSRRRSSEVAPGPYDEVELELLGLAASDDQLLELLDALYASSLFLGPDLQQESLDERSGERRFRLDVTYLLRQAEEETPGEPVVVLGEAGETAPPDAAAGGGLEGGRLDGGEEPTLAAEVGAAPAGADRGEGEPLRGVTGAPLGLEAETGSAPPPTVSASAGTGERGVRQRYVPPQRTAAGAPVGRSAAPSSGAEGEASSPREGASQPASAVPAGIAFGVRQQPSEGAGDPSRAPVDPGVTPPPASAPPPAGADRPQTPRTADPQEPGRPARRTPTVEPPPEPLAPGASATPRLRRPRR